MNEKARQFSEFGTNPADTPVLLLIFNRLEGLMDILSSIRAAGTRRLYISGDGPRNEEERIIVERVREEVLQAANWGCEVKTHFNSENLGCRKAVSRGISWFFENEESGIILEDDCLPHPRFLNFCTQFLPLIEADGRYASVGGTRFRTYGKIPIKYAAQESKVFFCWGWATRRELWIQLYQDDLPEIKEVLDYCTTDEEKRYWKNVWKSCRKGKVDSWAYRYSINCLINGKRHIVPPQNLVLNIGYDGRGTHSGHRPYFVDDHFPKNIDLSQSGEICCGEGLDKPYYITQFRSPPLRYLLRIFSYLGFSGRFSK